VIFVVVFKNFVSQKFCKIICLEINSVLLDKVPIPAQIGLINDSVKHFDVPVYLVSACLVLVSILCPGVVAAVRPQ